MRIVKNIGLSPTKARPTNVFPLHRLEKFEVGMAFCILIPSKQIDHLSLSLSVLNLFSYALTNDSVIQSND